MSDTVFSEVLDGLPEACAGAASPSRVEQPFGKFELETLFMLARAAAARDDDTVVHMVRIGFLARRLAMLTGCSQDFAEQLRNAAPLHDIGKIAIPDNVLKKNSPLTREEWFVMRQHSSIGAGILGRSAHPVFRLGAVIALNHHERFDGTGYPSRLAGTSIPLAARITSVVDVFDALTMDRSYRPAYGVDKALEMLAEESGKSLDPDLVDCFMTHAVEFIELRECICTSDPDLWDALGLDRFIQTVTV
ncbi:hypothetical protein BH10PSE17_BH10PSE17_05000 [soil metagenome]